MAIRKINKSFKFWQIGAIFSMEFNPFFRNPLTISMGSHYLETLTQSFFLGKLLPKFPIGQRLATSTKGKKKN
jgi:hypothetical protein